MVEEALKDLKIAVRFDLCNVEVKKEFLRVKRIYNSPCESAHPQGITNGYSNSSRDLTNLKVKESFDLLNSDTKNNKSCTLFL